MIENGPIPVKGVMRLDQMAGRDAENDRLLKLMASQAQTYLRSFPWCKQIREAYFGDGYGGIVAVFLFRIEPARSGVDEWLWVIFGDIPPAYLVIDTAKTPSQALESYIEEMTRWVDLAKRSKSSRDAIPVTLPATPDNAAQVEKGIRILRETFVPAFREAETTRA